MSIFLGTVQLRHGSRAQWAASNPILLAGEAAVETDTGMLKFGDGASPWNILTYIAQDAGNIDGGAPDSVFGGTNPLDGGGP